MKRSSGIVLVTWLVTVLAVAALASSLSLSVVDAAGRGGQGGRGGHAAGGGHAGGGGGGTHAQGGQGHRTTVNNNRADVRTNNVRSTSVNNVNVNVNRSVNVDVDTHGRGWDHDYHPVATAAAVTAAATVIAAVVGSVVRSVPSGCVPVNYGGMIYQQCGATWYLPQGPQYVVVAPPY